MTNEVTPIDSHPAIERRATTRKRSWRDLLRDPVPWIALPVVLLADQVSKQVVIDRLPYGHSWPEQGFFRITHAVNTGTAFGLFPEYGGLLTLVSLVAIAALFVFYKSASNPPLYLRVAFGMQLGGAIGNLVDRVRLGHVTDFLDVGPWPVFNIADSSIVVGIILMAWFFWNGLSDEKDEKKVRTTPQAGALSSPDTKDEASS